jgi:hypothetical protein
LLDEGFLVVWFLATEAGDKFVIKNTPEGSRVVLYLGGVVTDGENEIELRRIWLREFVPTLASKTDSRNVCDFKLAQCLRDRSRSVAAGGSAARFLRYRLHGSDESTQEFAVHLWS